MREVTLSLENSVADDALSGRIIAVTGAGSGLGLAAARSLAAHGATVVLLGRRQRPLEKAYDAILAEGGPEPVIHPMDLAKVDAAACTAFAHALADSLGGLHGLLHNAASLGALAPLEHCEPEDWASTLQVNLNAAFLLTRACLPLLRQSGDGRLLFTTAEVAREPRAYWGGYAASKAAVEALAAVVAEEEEKDGRVRVACLDPGHVRTRLHLAAWPTTRPGELPEPERLAPAYLQFMAEPGRALHGCRLLVDSGVGN